MYILQCPELCEELFTQRIIEFMKFSLKFIINTGHHFFHNITN